MGTAHIFFIFIVPKFQEICLNYINKNRVDPGRFGERNGMVNMNINTLFVRVCVCVSECVSV